MPNQTAGRVAWQWGHVAEVRHMVPILHHPESQESAPDQTAAGGLWHCGHVAALKHMVLFLHHPEGQTSAPEMLSPHL